MTIKRSGVNILKDIIQELDKAITEDRRFNLGLDKIGDNKYRLIMPDEITGALDYSAIKEGFSIKWPVNPHFTGRNALAYMISDLMGYEIEV